MTTNVESTAGAATPSSRNCLKLCSEIGSRTPRGAAPVSCCMTRAGGVRFLSFESRRRAGSATDRHYVMRLVSSIVRACSAPAALLHLLGAWAAVAIVLALVEAQPANAVRLIRDPMGGRKW